MISKEGFCAGRADEDDQPLFHIRQQGVLLGLVETVDRFHEQDRGPAPRLECLLRLGRRFSQILFT